MEGEKRDIFKGARNFYDKQYKKLLIIPFLILALALISLGVKYAVTGDFINRAVSLKGGLTVTIPTEQPVDIDELEEFIMQQFPDADVSVRLLKTAAKQKGVIIEASDVEKEPLISALEQRFGIQEGDYSIEIMGSSLGASFFREIVIAVLIAFVFMGIVVFLYFRAPIPSLAVMLSAFSDIVVTLAIVNLLGFRISTAGIAAFLMLIGYSVDTDILLTTRVLKRKEGEVFERVMGAFKTGMTMTLTTIIAVFIAYTFSQSDVLRQIMLIIMIGLVVDMMNTWIQNVGLIRLYIDKKWSK